MSSEEEVLGHARLNGEPVLIDWAGKVGMWPRVGQFYVYGLDRVRRPGYVAEHRLKFGGCSDRHHAAEDCTFLKEPADAHAD
jgi:hypothetical protein